MNPTHSASTPTVAPGERTSIALLIFEATDTKIPVLRLDGYMIQDKLREDQDFGECSFTTLRPARWSALNEF